MRSYRQLPFSAYHFQTKGRDEARPRAGILRTREFIMKDAYTFDRDRAGLDEHYERFRERLRPHLRPRAGSSGTGSSRTSARWAASAPTSTWRRARRARTTSRWRPATPPTSRSRAPSRRRWSCPAPRNAPEDVPTPGLTTIAEVAGKLHLPEGALLKSFR